MTRTFQNLKEGCLELIVLDQRVFVESHDFECLSESFLCVEVTPSALVFLMGPPPVYLQDKESAVVPARHVALHVEAPCVFLDLIDLHIKAEKDALLDLFNEGSPEFGLRSLGIVNADVGALVAFALVEIGADLVVYGCLQTKVIVGASCVLARDIDNQPFLVLFRGGKIDPGLDLATHAVLVDFVVLKTDKKGIVSLRFHVLSNVEQDVRRKRRNTG